MECNKNQIVQKLNKRYWFGFTGLKEIEKKNDLKILFGENNLYG